MTRKFVILMATLLVAGPLYAQTQMTRRPDCELSWNTIGTGRSPSFDNRIPGCTTWHFFYYATGVSSISIRFDYAPSTGGQPGSWTVWPSGDLASGTTLPLTDTASGQATGFKFHPWISINITTLAGTSQQVTARLIGWRPEAGQDSAGVGTSVATGVAQGSTTSGQTGTLIQGAVTTAAPTYTTGQTSPLSLTTGGAQRVEVSNLVADTVSAPVFVTPTAFATGGMSTHYRTSTGATEDEHEIKATPGKLSGILVTNTNAAFRYCRCANLTAANTTPGTSTVFFGFGIPPNSTGSPKLPAEGVDFSVALTCWLVTGVADTDVAEVAANEIKITYWFK